MLEAEGRRIVAQRCGGRCERCGSSTGLTFHHRRKRSQGGGWEPSNGLMLCWVPCHSFIENNPTWAHAQGFWLRAGQTGVTAPVWLWGRAVLLADDGRYLNV